MAASLHGVLRAEDRVDRRPQGLRAVDHKEVFPVRFHAAPHQVFQQAARHHLIFARAFGQPQHVLAPLAVHTHRPQHLMIAEPHPVDVNHQQFDLVPAALA